MDEGVEPDVPPEINVTPLIDVLMSLLIIFMASNPPPEKVQQPIKIPQDKVEEKVLDPNAALLVTIDDNGLATLGTTPLPPDLNGRVEAFKNSEKAIADNKIAIAASEKISYGQVMDIVAAARQAGIGSVSLASERISDAPSASGSGTAAGAPATPPG